MPSGGQSRNFVLGALKKSPALFLASFFAIAFLKLINFGLPVIMGRLIDSLNAPGDVWEQASPLLAAFVAIWALTFIVAPFQQYLLAEFVQTAILESSVEWLQRIFRKDLPFFNQVNAGKMANLTDRGISSHEKLLYQCVEVMLPTSIELVITFVGFWIIGGPVVVMLMLPIVLAQVLLTGALIRKRRGHLSDINDTEDELAGELIEVVRNGLVFKLERASARAIGRVKRQFVRYADAAVNLAVSGSVLSSLHPGFVNLMSIAMIGYGIWAISRGNLTIGALVTLIAIAGRLSASIGETLQSVRFVDQFKVDATDFLKLLAEPEFDRSGISAVSPRALKAAPMTLIRGENGFSIKAPIEFQSGERVAIVGPTGGGKTTFLEILAGMMPQAREAVTIDNSPLSAYSSEAHFRMIRYCPQGNYLLSGPVAESAFFADSLGDAQSALLRSLLLNGELAAGRREISEGAKNISGGEARRLALSRLLARKGAIHIFDEPTAALNEQVKGVVWDHLFGLGDGILVCTTHDYERLDEFDRIIIIEGGRIVMDGTAEDVLRSDRFRALKSDGVR